MRKQCEILYGGEALLVEYEEDDASDWKVTFYETERDMKISRFAALMAFTNTQHLIVDGQELRRKK